MTISPVYTKVSNDGSDTYLLDTGKEAVAHLERQQKFLAQDTYEHLLKVDLKVGQIIWDIGCGIGIMTEYLAKRVGPEGHIYAVDISPMQISIAKERVLASNLKNITFISADISSFKSKIYPQADIVYSRLVLMHLNDPISALKNMKTLLKTNGKIALQESIISSAHVYPESKAVNRYKEILIALTKAKNIDYDIGNKLLQLCSSVGFNDLFSYIVQHKVPITNEYKQAIIERLKSIESQAIEFNLTTALEVTEIIDNINSISEDNKEAYLATGDQSYYIGVK